jgi:hypothetical protein
VKTLNQSAFFPEKFHSAAAVEEQFRGDISLYSGTLPGWVSASRAISIDSTAISIDSTAISIDFVISHDEEGVVLPWG